MLRKALLATAASERVRELARVTPAARAVAGRYVAGESIQEAVDVARALRSAGLLVTLNYLGEQASDAQRAAATAAQYVHLLSKLAAEGLAGGGAVEVSVKPSALGLLLAAEGEAGAGVLGQRVAAEYLERIAVAARDAGPTVTVDAEDHRATDAALRMAAALRLRWSSSGSAPVGSVVQAALRRTEADVRALATPEVRVRLCKGGYAEPASQALFLRSLGSRS